MIDRANLQLLLGASGESKNASTIKSSEHAQTRASTLKSSEHAQTLAEDELDDGSYPASVEDLYPTTSASVNFSIPASILPEKDIYLIGELCRITCG